MRRAPKALLWLGILPFILIVLVWLVWLRAPEPNSQSENMKKVANLVELDGTKWRLLLLKDQAPLEGTTLTMEVTQGEVKGFAGCNWYTWYPAMPLDDPSSVKFQITVMKCMDPVVMAQEETYVEAILSADVFRVEGSKLDFFNTSGKLILSFVKE